MNTRRSSFFAACLLTALPAAGSGQQASSGQPQAGGRSFDLGALQQAAVDTDPRLQQQRLLQAQTELRLHNIAAARLPTFAVDGQAQYQSDVPKAPLTVPG